MGRAIAQNCHQIASTKTSVGFPFEGRYAPVEATRSSGGWYSAATSTAGPVGKA